MRSIPVLLLAIASTSAFAADPRDNPVLTDFSEWNTPLPTVKPTSEGIAAAVAEALVKQCGDRGAPSAAETYTGHFNSVALRQQINFATCGDHPFKAPRVFVVTGGGSVMMTGDSWGGTMVRTIEDLDGDKLDEIVMQKKSISSGVTSVEARISTYKDGAEAVVRELGEVYTSFDPTSSADACKERAAVIFLKVKDLSKVTRTDYQQPCGATKQWTDVGPGTLP